MLTLFPTLRERKGKGKSRERKVNKILRLAIRCKVSGTP